MRWAFVAMVTLGAPQVSNISNVTLSLQWEMLCQEDFLGICSTLIFRSSLCASTPTPILYYCYFLLSVCEPGHCSLPSFSFTLFGALWSDPASPSELKPLFDPFPWLKGIFTSLRATGFTLALKEEHGGRILEWHSAFPRAAAVFLSQQDSWKGPSPYPICHVSIW